MAYFTTPVNESPLISKKAGAELTDVRGRAVKFDDNGNIVLAGAGDAALGIALTSSDDVIPVGGNVDIQVRAIGLVKAGAAIAPGDELTPDANGTLVPATSGAYIAVALQEATAAGEFVQALITRGSKTAGA